MKSTTIVSILWLMICKRAKQTRQQICCQSTSSIAINNAACECNTPNSRQSCFQSSAEESYSHFWTFHWPYINKTSHRHRLLLTKKQPRLVSADAEWFITKYERLFRIWQSTLTCVLLHISPPYVTPLWCNDMTRSVILLWFRYDSLYSVRPCYSNEIAGNFSRFRLVGFFAGVRRSRIYYYTTAALDTGLSGLSFDKGLLRPYQSM